MKVFLDFDDVLFNTKKFRADYFRIFRKNGISKKVFEECYYDPIDSEKEIKRYDPVKHVKRICMLNGIMLPKLKNDIVKFVDDTNNYIFTDVTEFLGTFRKRDLYLVSFSLTDFQKSKIGNSGIAKKFQQIEIVNELKAKAISGLIKKNKLALEDSLFFIDDRVEQLVDVKKKFSQIKTILLKRKEGRYFDEKDKHVDFECTNLKQAKKIILKNS